MVLPAGSPAPHGTAAVAALPGVHESLLLRGGYTVIGGATFLIVNVVLRFGTF